MAKRKVSNELLEEINRLQFGLAEKVMDQFGCFDPAMYLLDVSETKVLKITSVPLAQDFKDYIAKKLPGLIAKYSVVVVMVEAWQTTTENGAEDRKEIIGTTLYANDSAYTAFHEILRNPTRLVFSDLTEPTSYSGAIAPGGTFAQLTPREVAKTVAVLRDLIKSGDKNWESGFTAALSDFIRRSPDISPITDMLYDVSLPGERAYIANQILDHTLTVHYLPEQREELPNQMWLAGIIVNIGYPTGDPGSVDVLTLPSGTELIARFAQNVRELMPPYIPFYPAPRGETFALESYFPVSVLSNLAASASAWNDPDAAPFPMQDYIDEHNERMADKYRTVRINPPGVMLFAAAFDRSEKNKDPFATRHEDEWGLPTKTIEEVLTNAAAKTTSETGVQIEVGEVLPAYDGLHLLGDYQMLQLVHSAMNTEELESASAIAEITMASYSSPQHHEGTFVTLYHQDGRFVTALSFPRKPHQVFPRSLETLAENLRMLGIQDIRIYPEIVKAEHELVGQSLEVLAPDFQGGWFSVSDMKIPQAKGMLRKAGWEYVHSSILARPDIARLPYPHRLARAGLAEVLQRHYSGRIYKLLKEVFSASSTPTIKLWDEVCAREPRFRAFIEAMPNWSRPDELATRSTRVLWGKAPTLLTTMGLSERLALTDVNLDKLPARFLHSPFPISYLHFQAPPPNAAISAVENGATEDFVLEGAFLESFSTEAGRKFQVVPVWRSTKEPNRNIYAEITLSVDDDLMTIGDLLTESYEGKDYDASLIEENREAISEIVKVLVYLNLKDARIVPKPQRSELLRGIEKKKAEQQLKIRSRADGTCDHILVGPDSSIGPLHSPGVSGRTMPVHARRGHMHTYRTGKGRTEITLKFVEPIMVNRHLLKDDETAPTPKNYRLQ